jgi:hypothetical protein
MKRLAFALACLALLAACNKDKPEPSASAPAAPATTAAPPQASVASGSDQAGVPTEEDYEDEAEQKITAENADQELDKLEKEISN